MSDYHQQFRVPFDYPVTFTRDVFHPANPAFANTLNRRNEPQRHRALCFIDENVAACHPALVGAIHRYVETHGDTMELVLEPRLVTGGEAIKNDYRLTMEMVDTILESRLCRHSYVVAIGGGAVLDAVGFAASMVHRGLRTVRLPTTVLAQNDGGVGVKTGMNLHGGKNTIGTFAPPFAVVNDFNFLATLSDVVWRDGIAEAFKVAVIKDRPFFDELCRNAERLKARDQQAMERLVVRCAHLHLEHIRTSGDPFEKGAARPLDFGHWSAHRLEAMSAYGLSHGGAVAVGIALDTDYAMREGWLTRAERDRVHQGLSACGLPLWYDLVERRLGDGSLEILQGLDDFKEHLGGRLTVTYPRGLGNCHEVHEVDRFKIEESARYLKSIARVSHPAS